ncbi:hypothetical protein PILCRDRAFT_815012, partial [Piloderma croceum F 1598]
MGYTFAWSRRCDEYTKDMCVRVILSALRDAVGRTTNARRGGGVIVSGTSQAQVAAKKERKNIIAERGNNSISSMFASSPRARGL